MKLPISVFIITKNEEDRVPLAIKSTIEWADEVIVIDSGSSDNTMEIAKECGATAVYNEWKGYGAQKIYGETICKNKWLLNIDADEEISPSLRDEIIEEFKSAEPGYKAYSFIIKDVNRFSSKYNKFTPSHTQTRLYNRNYSGFKDSTVHDSVVFKNGLNETVYKFRNFVLHRSFRSYTHAIAKINYYSSMQAEDMFRRGKRPSSIRIVFEPFTAFFKGYFLKKHYLLGFDGFVEGVIYSFARTLRLVKTRELWKNYDYKQNNDI